RPRIPKKSYRRSAAVLRKAAKHLAESRDSYVKLHALKALVSEERSHIKPGTFSQLRIHLQNACAEKTGAYVANGTAPMVESLLREFETCVCELKIRAKGWKAL